MKNKQKISDQGLIEKICYHLSTGIFPTRAAELAGVDRHTIKKWLAIGRGDEPLPPYMKRSHVDYFYQRYLEADTEAQQRILELAIRKDPVKILEKRWPEEWGEKPPMDSTEKFLEDALKYEMLTEEQKDEAIQVAATSRERIKDIIARRSSKNPEPETPETKD